MEAATQYSLRDVLALDLPDSPCLFVPTFNEPIQIAHVAPEHLLSVRGAADTTWRYVCTTGEGIPVFHYVGDPNALIRCMNVLAYGGPGSRKTWITPKGFPRPPLGMPYEGSPTAFLPGSYKEF